MQPLQLSSGDLLADRRADYAEMLFANGEHGAAAELMLGALERAPQWALGWFRMGEMHEAAGALDAAAEAWRTALKLDPADRAGAALKLELIGLAPSSSAPPSSFVETLFDQYADTFDAALVDKLDYRVPGLLAGAIAATGRSHFRSAVDLGCGTGLMGERLRPLCDVLEGVDISAAMLRKARARGVYDRLTKADLQSFAPAAASADLVTAADVFMYVGALEAIFARVATTLVPGGLFAFSVERNDTPEPFRLRETRRYAHVQAYVEQAVDGSGLSLLSLAHEPIRRDRDEAVQGMVVVAQAPG